jgi:hypothetical protein
MNHLADTDHRGGDFRSNPEPPLLQTSGFDAWQHAAN